MNYYDNNSFILIEMIISFWDRVNGLALRDEVFAFRIIRTGAVVLLVIFRQHVGFITVLNVISVLGVISAFDVINVFEVNLFHAVIFSIVIFHAFLVSFPILRS